MSFCIETRPLMEVLRKDYQRHAHNAELLFYDWPKAKEVAISFIKHVGLHLRRREESLALAILCEALNAYSEVTVFSRRSWTEKVDDALRLATFVNALVTVAVRDLQIAVESERGSQWTLPGGEAFSSWLDREQGDLAVYHQSLNDELPVRALLYGTFAPESVKKILKRADYEDAILANRLAVDS